MLPRNHQDFPRPCAGLHQNLRIYFLARSTSWPEDGDAPPFLRSRSLNLLVMALQADVASRSTGISSQVSAEKEIVLGRLVVRIMAR